MRLLSRVMPCEVGPADVATLKSGIEDVVIHAQTVLKEVADKAQGVLIHKSRCCVALPL